MSEYRGCNASLRLLACTLLATSAVLAGCAAKAGEESVLLSLSEDNTTLLQQHEKQPSRHVIVFVHGFTGSARSTWGQFPDLLLKEKQLKGVDIFLWGYPTQLVGSNPAVSALADNLRSELRIRLKDYDSLTLIGHSLGGLVIQTMVINELIAGHAPELARIKNIILFATPNEGAQVPLIVRGLNRQLYDLSNTSETVERMRREMVKRVLRPEIRKGDENSKLNIPLTVVIGLQDQWVSEASAKSIFPEDVETVPGDHFTLKEPSNPNALSYILVRNAVSKYHGINNLPLEPTAPLKKEPEIETLSFEQITNRYKHSVLKISVEFRDEISEPFIITGTGFLISEAGYILTVKHLLRSTDKSELHRIIGAASLNGPWQDLTIVACDSTLDMCLLRMSPDSMPTKIVPVQLQSTSNMKSFQDVLIMGYPLDQPLSAYKGAITSVNSLGGGWLLDISGTPSISGTPNISGAPIFDEHGKVIAIVVGGYVDRGVSLSLIPIHFANHLLMIAGVTHPN